jgi:tRNA threonylcarbamoyladenosine biosynthesis protein TsaE
MVILINGLEDLPRAAREFVELIDGRNVYAFYGQMGAGKTTFIKAICNELGVKDNVVSPTYALINEYGTRKGQIIYHFDFYRIEKLEEVYDLGYEDYFYGGRLCLIEWPEKVEVLLPEDSVSVRISVQPDGSRVISIDENN